MRKEELRIGNLLNWNGIICPVVQIDETGFTVADNTQTKLNSNYHYFPDETITHWELTEEWLVEFGFKKVGELYIKNQIEIWYNEPTKRFYHSEQNIGVNTNHIHQLQNLYFALTNQELTLK